MKSEKGHSSLPDCYRFSMVRDSASLTLGNMTKLGALTGLYLEGIGAIGDNEDNNNKENHNMAIAMSSSSCAGTDSVLAGGI